ncbi:hypothetical protein D0Z07_8142 [Hyphodiscus hymeniophilus]|uniref:Biogenesis of lysosome-related organelles complex 1 subunit 1 n=1 Tax=Hyphodiscus hymeniophilus TaxID=353542 RepID=A0A9P6SM65_9HELO|nr:hypothetical protein D0Z07_8142 [Hyphodiscus hymeniophilus]
MSASASASVSASTSTNPPSNSHPPSTSQNASSSHQATSTSQSASPTLPHSPETARQIAEARSALEASMNNIGSSLDHTLKSRAQNLHANSAALEKQQKELTKETEKMRKETDKLKKVADEGARRVKELGNVQNWAEMIERDFLLLGETMRLVRKGDGESGWDGNEEGWETSSGSGSWSSDGEDLQADVVMGVDDGSQQRLGNAGEMVDKIEVDETVKPEVQLPGAIDAEDTAMDELDQHKVEETGKGKEVEGRQHTETAEGSSTTATSGSGSASTAEPFSSSIHTAASTTG